jgi:pimeloyl-ACP methyl ester carboxylesterase
MDYTIGAHVQDVMAILDSLSIDRCAVVGHSLGGAVASLLAARAAERVSLLVIIDTGPRHLGDGRGAIRSLLADGPFESLEQAVAAVHKRLPGEAEDALRTGLARRLAARPDGRLDWIADARPRRSPEVQAALDADRARVWAEVEAAAPSFKFPVVVVRGSKSRVLTAEGAHWFSNLISNGTATEVQDAGHNVHRDQPAQLAALIDHHLTSIAPTERSLDDNDPKN